MMDRTFPKHEFLTVRELADLLRLKERKIYDLAASGAVPCSRATGKLLFPAEDIRQWIADAKSGGGIGGTTAPRPNIVLGSHDPLLDWAIRQSRCGLATYFDGSLDGLERFASGDGMAVALHIHDKKTSVWNIPAVSQVASQDNAVLIAFSKRRRGLVVRPDSPAPEGIAQLAGMRVAPRQAESGSDRLFQDLAANSGLDLAGVTFTDVARTEDDAVDSVRRGEADVTFGLEAVARAHDMTFVPLVEEEFSLLVDRKAWFDTAFQTLLAFCGTSPFLKRAKTYSGYDVSTLGTVVWNA